MNYNDDWTEGLNQKQQNMVIDYTLDCGQIKGNAKEKYGVTLLTVKKFLNSEKGKKAIRRYVQSKYKSQEDLARMKWLEIHFARAFYHPGDIITPNGNFISIDEKEIKSLHQLGSLGYCVEGVKTKIIGFDKKSDKPVKEIEIKLCNRDKSLEAIKNIYRMDEEDADTDERSIFNMSDEERDNEILQLIKDDPALLEYVKGEEE